MKLHPDVISARAISGYGHGWIGLEKKKIFHSVIVGSHGERLDWACRHFQDLTAEHFAPLATMGAELIIFGSGQHLRFPQAAWIRPLIEQQIGIETMDTQAACRTYNILANEGRHVVVALLLEPSLD